MSLGPQFAEVMQNLPGGDALGTFDGDAQAVGTGCDQARFIAAWPLAGWPSLSAGAMIRRSIPSRCSLPWCRCAAPSVT